MKPEQQRIAIAEACRWEDIHQSSGAGSNLVGFPPRIPGEPFEASGEHLLLPDYLNDLNAMHEAEKTLKSYGPDDSDRTVSDRMIEYAERLNYEIDAPAAQRAEAFLRTLKLWIDEN